MTRTLYTVAGLLLLAAAGLALWKAADAGKPQGWRPASFTGRPRPPEPQRAEAS